MIHLILALSVMLAAAGCGEDPKHTVEKTMYTGSVIGVQHIQGSKYVSPETIVKTSKGSFALAGARTIFLGDETDVRYYSSGLQFMCFASSDKCIRID